MAVCPEWLGGSLWHLLILLLHLGNLRNQAIALDEDTTASLKPLLAQMNPARAVCLQCPPPLDAASPANALPSQSGIHTRHSQATQPAGPDGHADIQAGAYTECAADRAARSANLQALEDLFFVECEPNLKVIIVEHQEQLLGMFK